MFSKKRRRQGPPHPGFKRRRKQPQRFRGRFANGGELKFHDLDIDDSVIASGGNITEDSVLTIAQGTTESTRIGRKLVVRQINWKFTVSLLSTSDPSDTSDTVRVILYLDKQTNGATAAVTDILETADYQSFKQLANKSRFTTLMDRTYSLTAQAGAFDGTNDQFGEVRIDDSFYKTCNIPIEYDNTFTTGVIGTMRSNNIGVLLLSLSGNGGFASKMRIRFSDA